MKIIVTGANGQLGMTFQDLSSQYPEYQFFFFGSEVLDITQSNSITTVIDQVKPEVVINCAAYTAVDKAEDEPEKAFAVNANGVKNLVHACENFNASLVHISTDYVFDGTKKEPYTEVDETNPINVYGESKLAGEKYLLASNLKAIIIRTSWVYSEFGNNFVKTMLRLGKERESLNVVNDQFGSPTYAKDLATAIFTVLNQFELWSKEPIILHYSNIGVISWFQFAEKIMEMANLNCKMNPVNSDQYYSKAKRPISSSISNEKIIKCFGISPVEWEKSLNKVIQKVIK